MTSGEQHPQAIASTAAGVNLAGYFDSALGAGEAARQLHHALLEVGVAVERITLPERRSGGGSPDRPPAVAPHPVTVICANADAMEGARDWLGPAYLGGHVVALWWWELETFPDRWRRSFDGLDEVWVGSEWVADAIAPAAPVPVAVIPTPVEPRPPSGAGRAQLGLPEGFCFLFVFDFASGFERKNPLGAIAAFTRAFPDAGEASLAIKHIGAEDHPAELARLEQAAAGHPSVHLVGGRLSPGDQAALMASGDCYVSLHRSEGFGLTLAEAVLAGCPVVATGYAGPMDFLDAESSYLVDHELCAVGPGQDPYPADARWADPDLDHAAELMRRAFDERDGAPARAKEAAARFSASHSPAAAGRAMVRRLRRFGGAGARPTPPGQEAGLGELERRIATPPPAPTAPLRRALGLLSERLGRPQAVRQRRVDEEILRSLRTLHERLDALEASLQAPADPPDAAGRRDAVRPSPDA